ncbi:GerW family sporulation protein [Anaerotignum sp.]|uniref:GerW family sporulation protein n=1 Tax=Anaerotignum sp. TaxID=2039241 RepID=UPI0028A18F89|nr:GerW family sporulation protein [Anaerotignum sp.]
MGKDFKESVDVLFNKVEDLVSTKTVVGEAITIGDITLLPLIEVAVGAGAGAKENVNAAGGVGARITPSAVLVIQNGSVQTINVKNQDAISKLIDMAPGVVNKLNFGAVFGNRDKKEPQEDVKFEEEVIIEEFEK